MSKTVKQVCRFNPVIQDYRMNQGIENLTDLINNEGNGRKFFARKNFVTHGMEQLFRESMLRLSGKSDQAVFELTQAMGGGKTHMMIALGLLTRHPDLRSEVLPADLNSRIDFESTRIAAISSYDNPDSYIRDEIATQLSTEARIRNLRVSDPEAVDQHEWKEIIGNQPTLILLDELPRYLQDASTRTSGKDTLADRVVYSLSSLMTAALELPNCAIVIASLSGNSYKAQTSALAEAIDNLQQEIRRQAMTITPVQLAGNEIHEILKKRLIDELPDERTIADIAGEYARQVKKAEEGGYIAAASIEQIAGQIQETYPFHPSFRNLVALFRENEGFCQTRGLIQFTAQLLKSVEQRKTDDVFLVGAQHLNLNDDQVRDEIKRIAPRLLPAVLLDIANDGHAIAEVIDDESGSDATKQVMTLLLTSSLSRAAGDRIGLSESEVIEFLIAPERKPDEFLEALQRLREQAWYLHCEKQCFFIKGTRRNPSHLIKSNAGDDPPPEPDPEQSLIQRLTDMLKPVRRNAWQEVQVFPQLDKLKLGDPRVIIVVQPDGKSPPDGLQKFLDNQQEKNNFLVLTGPDKDLADEVLRHVGEYDDLELLYKQLKPGPYRNAVRYALQLAEQYINETFSVAYDRLYFPGVDKNDRAALIPVTTGDGLKPGEKDLSVEAQIEAILAGPHTDGKLAMDLTRNFDKYFAMAEKDLWPPDQRRTPWKDVVSRARSNPAWPWMPGADGMDTLKTEALKQGRWRMDKDGYIEKGPFPKEKTLSPSQYSVSTRKQEKQSSV